MANSTSAIEDRRRVVLVRAGRSGLWAVEGSPKFWWGAGRGGWGGEGAFESFGSGRRKRSWAACGIVSVGEARDADAV